MTVLIYTVCLFCASFIQVLLRSLQAKGSILIIPGTFIIYGIALSIAHKLVESIKNKK